MTRVLIVVVIVALTIYCIVELAQSHTYRVRKMPKWLWAFTVICLPVIGPLAWLMWGRPTGEDPRRLPRDQGPDGDEDFLRGLRP
ncbi:PLDc_N domain-containing protein [Tessaracoccus rhinocerotis]|uniref:PLDc_N domain-containing protein n=1 Tax=Tessaracoccus rhinocerotis TaxID=1689449 RepID=A0A553K5L1_9ACTN|nr:PLD nuclease N-terminal domain-containing protein [Tessaracoccus rhinocerotis]TRY19995.1 PLDc_N domain-containing protein [Tessaracoccus rhinocerotis]